MNTSPWYLVIYLAVVVMRPHLCTGVNDETV